MLRGALTLMLLTAACAPRPSGMVPAPEVTEAAPAPRRRAIVVSFDAFSERRAREIVPAEAIPTIRSLFETAACADYALPAWPSKTAASHAAVWTGSFGNVNGIAANWQPPLPRDRHRITELVSGFSSEGLRAEPIWITAALAGRRVVAHHTTQAPGVPGYPPVTGARDPARVKARAAAASALADPNLLAINGYNGTYAPDIMVTAASAPPRDADGWRNLDRLGATVPPREIAWAVGNDSLFAVFYGPESYTRVLVSTVRDAAYGVTAEASPVERVAPHGRELARHFSEPLVLATPAGRAYARVRLFSLAADASDFLLFQPVLPVIESNHPEGAAAYGAALGGWVGNAPWDMLYDGTLGPRVHEGGDGTAELRYLEMMEYETRQFIRGSEWAWMQNPDLLADYFPVIDEADHTWYGYVDSGSPAYEAGVAATVQEMRARAWALADLRLAALLRLMESDSSAALFVTGDHGMRATWRTFRPNAALAAAGLLMADDSGTVDAARTRAIAPDGLYVMVNTTDWLDGVVPPDSAAAVLAVADSLLRAVRGADGEPVVVRTWIVQGDADSLGRGGPVGGGLYFETAPGYGWSRSARGAPASDGRVGGDHGFPSVSPDMHTLFCAAGAAFTPGRFGPVRVTDVAPTVSAWLGIPAPPFATGRVVVSGSPAAVSGSSPGPAAP